MTPSTDGIGPLHYDNRFFTRPDLFLHVEYSVFDSARIPEHLHDFDELVLVCHGRGVHCVEGHEHPICPGDVFYIRRGVRHMYREIELLGLLSIDFDPAHLDSFRADLEALPGFLALFAQDAGISRSAADNEAFPRYHLKREEYAHIERLVDSLREACANPGAGARTESLASFALVVVNLSRYCTGRSPVNNNTGACIAMAIAFIEDRYQNELTIKDLAEAACMSRSTLQRTFRQCMNCTPMEYVTQCRIDHAKELLENTQLSIMAVSEHVGFQDSNHFSRRYKALTGLSPSAYRTMHQKKR